MATILSQRCIIISRTTAAPYTIYLLYLRYTFAQLYEITQRNRFALQLVEICVNFNRAHENIQKTSRGPLPSFHRPRPPVSCHSRHPTPTPPPTVLISPIAANIVCRISVNHMQICAVAVCKLQSQSKLAIMPDKALFNLTVVSDSVSVLVKCCLKKMLFKKTDGICSPPAWFRVLSNPAGTSNLMFVCAMDIQQRYIYILSLGSFSTNFWRLCMTTPYPRLHGTQRIV